MPRGNARKAWLEEEIDRLRSMVADGLAAKHIALVLGRTQGAIEAQIARWRQKRSSELAPKRNERRRSGAAFFLS
jgi:transposase